MFGGAICGFKVPNSAIFYDDDLAYVTRNRAGYLDEILVKVTRSNETYSVVENYSTEELKSIGFTPDEIRDMKSIKLHDEVLKTR